MATFTADTCSRADINTKLGLMSAGDVLIVPAGTADWTGGITLNGVRMLCAGKSTSGTVVTAGIVTLTKHATQYTKLSGVRFTGTSRHILVQGDPAHKAFIIADCYLNTNGGEGDNTMLRIECNGGLVYDSDFVASTATNADVMNFRTSETWVDDDQTIGDDDTTGERNLYMEDNTYTKLLETAPDGDARIRLVIRHNTFTDSSIVFHSGFQTTALYSDTTDGGGTRHFEVYNNNFFRDDGNVALNKWIWVRGGTGVIAYNSMDIAGKGAYPNKYGIRLTTNCNGQAYPLEHQVGQIDKVTDATPALPLLIFGNTAGDNTDGPADAYFYSVASSGSGGAPVCANPTFYIQEDRDFFFSEEWDWTPYTYPHPLTLLDSGDETQAPAVLVPMRMIL